MKYWLAFVFLVFSLPVKGQTVAELENQLFVGDESDSAERRRMLAADRLLQLDAFNVYATNVKLSRKNSYKGAAGDYFEQLWRRFPGSPEPILLRIQLAEYRGRYEISQDELALYIDFIERGLAIPSIRSTVQLALAKAYYGDYLRPRYPQKYPEFLQSIEDTAYKARYRQIAYGKWIEWYHEEYNSGVVFVDISPVFEHPADSALKYFREVWKADTAKTLVYFPIRQLECLSHKDGSVPEVMPECEACYAPFGYYTGEITEPWICRDSINYLRVAEDAIRAEEGQEKLYRDRAEPSLYTRHIKGTDEAYRFTFTPSFHNTIIVRLEKQGSRFRLSWKELIRPRLPSQTVRVDSGSREISSAQYSRFKAMLADAGFEKLPPSTYIIMTDGAGWKMERRTAAGFKAHSTNWPRDLFSDACRYLVGLSDLKMPKGYR